jgi:peptide deformylase
MSRAIEAVERPARVRVGYQDIDGVPAAEEADGLLKLHQMGYRSASCYISIDLLL